MQFIQMIHWLITEPLGWLATLITVGGFVILLARKWPPFKRIEPDDDTPPKPPKSQNPKPADQARAQDAAAPKLDPIILSNGWVISFVQSDGGVSIYKSNRDHAKKALLQSDIRPGGLRICGQSRDCLFINAYIGKAFGLWEIDPGKGTVKRLTKDSASCVAADDNRKYYINHGNRNRVYRMWHDGSNKKAITRRGACYMEYMGYGGNEVFFIDHRNRKIYKKHPFGSSTELVTEDEAEAFCIRDYYVYYINRSDGNRLYRISYDGDKSTRACLSKHGGYCDCRPGDGKRVYFYKHEDLGHPYKYDITNNTTDEP